MSGFEHAALHALVVTLLGLVAVLGGAPVVQAIFRQVDRRERRELVAGGSARQALEQASRSEPGSRLEVPVRGDGSGSGLVPAQEGVIAAGATLRGGVWIGRLERLAIYAGLVAHYPQVIPICLAMKALARYPELRATTAGAAERFIIGSFTSVLFACGMAGLEHWIDGLW